MHAGCHAGTRRRSHAKRVALSNVLPNDHSRQKSAITTIRIERLDVAKAPAALDPAGCGLDAASAQLEGRTNVMADEARPHFLR